MQINCGIKGSESDFDGFWSSGGAPGVDLKIGLSRESLPPPGGAPGGGGSGAPKSMILMDPEDPYPPNGGI